jgi:hypothetical protein
MHQFVNKCISLQAVLNQGDGEGTCTSLVIELIE